MNSAQWQLFTSREQQGFNLPAFRPRNETVVSRSARPTSVAEAMGSDKVKPGWQGETREALLATPDLLTEDIRLHPRKYFHPPGLSKGKEKALAKTQMMVGQLGQAEYDRRKAEGDLHDRRKEPVVAAAPRSPAFARFPPALESRPFLSVVGGSHPADTMTWSYVDRSWKTAWSGTLLPGKHASGTIPLSLFRPQPHAPSGEAVSATWSYLTRRWKIIWADDSSMESARFAESTQLSSDLGPRGQKRSREEQPESQAGTVDNPLQALPQLSFQPVQRAPVAENEDEHRDKKTRRDVTSLEAGNDNNDQARVRSGTHNQP